MNEKTNKIKMLAIFFIVLIVFSQLSLAASEQKIEKLEVKRDSKENPKSDGRQVKTKSSTNALSASMPTETPPAMLNTGAKDSFTNVLSNLDKGSFHNDLFSGSATYSYSFKVPPAPNNFIPKASINYNHHQATLRTELGNAWSLSKSYIYRNTEGTRTQTDDDTYYLVLNGATAKLVYVPNEDRYHTEQESYSHIKQDGETWTVKTKEGTIFRFGINQETSLESSLESYTSLWYLEEVEDTHSNKINYHYLKNPEQDKSMYLDKIIYSTNEIKFNYNFNAHNGFYGYIYGTKIEQTALLDNIEIKTNNVLQRKYKLDYKTIDDKKFLNKIRKIGNDGTSELPPVEFRYYENSKGWTIDNNWVLPDDANTGWDKDLGTRLLDFNSDGLTDIIKSRGNIHNIWYNTGNGFTEKKTLDNFIPGGIASGSVDKGVRFGNINEDAKIDVIKSVKGTNTVKELRINKQDHLIEEESNFPAEAAFVDIKINDCTPDPCDPGGEDHGIKCYDTSCRRKCYYENKVCSNNWVSVHESQGNGYDEMYDSENRDITNGYYVSGNDKCYKFEVDTPNSAYIGIYEDECDIGAEDDGDVVFIAGLFTNRGSNSWLQKVPAIDQYRSWYGNLEKPYNDADFEGSYLTSYEWTEESFEFGAEPRFAADNREVYCAPNYKNDYDTCIASNLYPCAFGCDNERIYAYVQSGYYYDPGHDFISTIALDDNCDRHQVWNHAGKYIKMKVYASDTSIETDWIDKVCMKTTEVRDLGVRLADVNGDGKTDIVKAPYFDNLKKIWLKTDNGWEENEEWKPEINIHFTYHYGESDGTILIDINGDNLPDFIKGNGGVRKFWINTGKNWIEDSTWKLPYEATIIKDKENQGVQITDINSDGLPDLIRAYDDIKKIWINNGRGWTEDTEWILPDKTNFRLYAWSLTDIEGDASPDIIYAAVMDSSWGKAYINKYSKQYLLKEIKNNVGGTTKIDYKKITSLDNTGNDALSDLPFNGWVVHSIEIDNGMTNDHGIKSSYTIDYSDGLFDDSNGDEKEFRGFGYVEETKIDGSKIKHWFHQDKKKKGLEYETKIMNENNKLFKKSEKHFVSQTTDPYYVVQLAASKDFTYDGVNNNPTIKQVDLDYDDFGNVVKISSLGDKSIEGDEKYSYTTYLNDVDKWIIGKPTRTYLLDSDDLTKISESFFEYDQYGGLIKSESWLNTGTNPTITYEYNSFGNLILQKDPNQNEVEYEHDSTHTYLIKTTNSLGHILEYEYDDYGNLISTTDSNENKIEYKYDVFNRKVKEIYPYDSEETPTIEYIYEFDGIAPEKTITKKKTDQDQTLDSYSYYSGLGNLIQSKIESIDSKLITSDYYYDDLLRLNSKTIPYYANNNEYTNPNKELLTTYNYDTLNRIIKVNNPDNTITKVNYNKYITTTYDENNNRHDFIKDSSGNVIEVKEYNGEEIYLTTYEYDINNNLIKITDSQDNEIKYSYDTLGRKTTLDDPDLGIWTYQYDNMGNLIKQTNNKNQEIILTYGQLNRLKTKTSEETSETYTYDQETKGTLSKIETNDITKEFEYDNRLRLIKEKKKIDNIDFITTYGYDSADRVTKKTLPNNEEIIYDYDKAGNLKSVNNVITDIQYNEINMPISKTYKNNLISQYDYDNENFRLNSIKTSDVQDLSYEYDNVGNILIIQNQIQNKKQEFEYDDLDRLTKAKKTKQDNQEIDYEITYNYDSIGNMLNLNSDVGDLEYLYENLAHTPSTIITDSDEFPCLPNWECSEWSECVGRKQSRTCVELNECERPIPKPREHQSCNNPPAIIGPPAEERTMTKKETDLITLNVNAVDEEELTYSINDENFVQDNVEKSKFTWQTDYNDAGTYYPIITVSDGLDTVDVSFRLTIENLNAAPTIEPIKDMTVNEGEKAEVIINAEDIDNDELTYSIDDDRFIQSNGQDSGFLITDDFSDNDYTNNPAWEFMYSGDDQIGGSQAEIKDGKIKITSRRTDAAFLTIGEFDWSDYSIQADIKFSNIKDYGGLVAGIGEPDENGKFTKNAYLILNGQDESFELSYRDVANSILVKDRAIQTISEDIAYTLKLELKDFEIIGYINGEEKLSIDVPTIVQGKAGLVVSSGHPSTIEFDNVYIKSKTNNNNIFTWQTTYEDGGIYDIIATVSDGTEQSTNSFLLTINNINDAPIVENIEPMTIDETDTAELIINAQDPDNDKLTYSVTITRSTIVAPKSDIFIQDPNQENKFTWKTNYEDMGTYYVYVNVDDGKSKTSKDFSLTVNDINAPPTIEPIEDITVDENELVTITINANDIDEDTMTYSVNNDNFVKTEQSNVFEWQTNHEDEGTYNIIVTVSDGTEDITEDLTITIENCKEEWSCTDWTECTDSSQTRICIDNSKCESEEDKPQEQQQCEMPCIEEWSCAEWSDCVDELQTRVCNDANKCETTEDKPITQQECIMPCTEDWSCNDWSECADSSQTRTCTDNNQCETEEDKPQEQQQCEMPCIEDWSCNEWSDCTDSSQTRTCTDNNQCETTEDKPTTQQECEMPCIEDWIPGGWSECIDGIQTLSYVDFNQCGTENNKPTNERECETNNPPILESIGNKQIDELKVLDIWVEASDEDKDDELILTHDFPKLTIAENYNSGSEIRTKYRWQPQSDDAGTYNVLFKVEDSKGAQDQEQIKIIVNDIQENTAPYISPKIDDIQKDMNSEPWTLDLTDYENDAQDTNRKLRWKVRGGNKNLIHMSLNTNTDELKFYPIEDQYGETIIKLTLRDSSGKTDTQDVKIMINQVENGPDYKLKIGAKDEYFENLINSVIKFGKKTKHANPYALFKMRFNEPIPVEIKAKDYTTKEIDYSFNERVPGCSGTCVYNNKGFNTRCTKGRSYTECISTKDDTQFSYVYFPTTKEFVVEEKLDNCYVACRSDSNCNDNKPNTKDYCINQGTCNAECQNEPCNVRCEKDSDCGNNAVCFLPKTCNSYCEEKFYICNMECRKNSDCNDNKPETYDICRNARTCNAKCEYITKPELKPELEITRFSVKRYLNNIAVVEFKIKNTGDTTAQDIHWQLNTGGGISDPQSTESLTLRPDQSATIYSTGNYQNSGSYTMVLTIDPNNLVKEQDESNNIRELGVSI